MDPTGTPEREHFADTSDYLRFHAACPVCREVAPCWSGDLPADLRGRLIGECGPARLAFPRQGLRTAVAMKVIRATFDVELSEARPMLQAVQSGRYAATLPEIEQLARRLRAAGVEARVVRD
ncbi:hypothetical protein [Kitasatospora sp. NPDC088346]|uniref:hypothetical protein n=1 Tax=Kitasatospora sp. NPDC088346 TaxID=3364073 RepID=UPI00381507FE